MKKSRLKLSFFINREKIKAGFIFFAILMEKSNKKENKSEKNQNVLLILTVFILRAISYGYSP